MVWYYLFFGRGGVMYMYVRGIDVAIVFSRGGMVMYMYVRGIDVAIVFFHIS